MAPQQPGKITKQRKLPPNPVSTSNAKVFTNFLIYNHLVNKRAFSKMEKPDFKRSNASKSTIESVKKIMDMTKPMTRRVSDPKSKTKKRKQPKTQSKSRSKSRSKSPAKMSIRYLLN